MYNDSALLIFKGLIMEDPDNSYAYSCSGIAHAGSGNTTDAVIAGKTAVELAGDDYIIEMSDMKIQPGNDLYPGRGLSECTQPGGMASE
ncbi:MAG: hypothetical protein U5L72_09985 [Bacteroidales bacterium]|nr:hypothetical protein [Bacteroidales bacterium]